jgi:hypothetical protein
MQQKKTIERKELFNFNASGGQMLHGTLFEKTAPLDPPQKLFINYLLLTTYYLLKKGARQKNSKKS